MKQIKLPYNRGDLYNYDPNAAIFDTPHKINFYYTKTEVWIKLPNNIIYKVSRPTGTVANYASDPAKWFRELDRNLTAGRIENYWFDHQIPLEKLIFCAFFLVFWVDSYHKPLIEKKLKNIRGYTTIENFKIRALLNDDSKFNIENYRVITGGLTCAIMGRQSAEDIVINPESSGDYHFTSNELIDNDPYLVFESNNEPIGRWQKEK